MDDIYVLNKNLEIIGLVENYKSCIWANRYNEIGDCELYVEATKEMFNLLKDDYYLMRLEDDMICQIKKVELNTNSENGDFLIVTGTDSKNFFDQRIIWETMNCNGNLEDFIREIINENIINPDLAKRKMIKPNGQNLLILGLKANFTEANSEQVSYKNVGEKIREYCKKYNWGYKLVLLNNTFNFILYKGTDRSNTVIFSDDYENLDTTKYIKDNTNIGNIALVAGEGEGSARLKNVSGSGESIDRYEIYVDARDISKTITWQELTELYPTTSNGGQGYITSVNNKNVYKMNNLDVLILDNEQLLLLKSQYPSGTEITIDDNLYYRINNIIIADLPDETLTDDSNVTLRDIIYSIYLLNRGYEKLSEYNAITSFEGVVEPNVTFEYKKDYFLGDLVTVENKYGISVVARIVEVVEVKDDNGYSIEPKFEYLEEV